VKRTPWIFFTVRFLLLLQIAFLTFLAKVGVEGLPPWLRFYGTLFASTSNYVIFVCAAGIALLEMLERVAGSLQFRKERVQGILDHIVKKLFEGKPKDHRCTLFRAAKGYVVLWIVLWRALAHQESRLLHLKTLPLRPFGTYLYVWARAKGNKNHRSCVAFRVYHREGKPCEGIAGRVWEREVYETHDMPTLQHADLEGVQSLHGLEDAHPVSRYARAGNVSSVSQLRARERFARHFYGAVIESPRNQKKWGVFLVDSTSRDCPWPTTNRGKAHTKQKDFEKEFESLTVILATVLT
jgi:hypothetical protein